jgi:hypothetical protein
MFTDTITVFNYHADSDSWYPSVISGVDLGLIRANNHTTQGVVSEDTVQILIPCGADQSITTTAGRKSYTGPKAYASCENPAECITFAPECDFIYEGTWPDLSAIADSDYDSGLYHDMNDEHDGVHLINSAAFYGLIPHFEIGGR